MLIGNKRLWRALTLKHSFPKSAFSARLAQSVERKALNLVVMGSSPTVGDTAASGAVGGGASCAPFYLRFFFFFAGVQCSLAGASITDTAGRSWASSRSAPVTAGLRSD